MSRKYKLVILAVGLVVILIVAAATTALAAQKARTLGATAPTEADYQAWGCPIASGNYQAVADLLGITTQDIETQLAQGSSLVEIAATKGVSEDQLLAVIFNPMKDFMQQQVTNGNWTQAQMDSHVTQAEQHIRQLINAKGNNAGYGGCGGAGGMMGNWVTNGGTSSTGNPGAFRGGMMGGWGTNNSGSFGRGGMMGNW